MRTQPSHKVTNSMSTPRGLGILPRPTELGTKKLLLVIFQNGSKDLQPHSPQWHSHHSHQKEMPKIITSQKKKNTWKFKKAFLLHLWIIMGGVKNWIGTHLYPVLYQVSTRVCLKWYSNHKATFKPCHIYWEWLWPVNAIAIFVWYNQFTVDTENLYSRIWQNKSLKKTPPAYG